MKKNLTELVFILDRSGSMQSLASDTIGGFNSMIETQKKESGEAYVTTVLFDHDYELLHDHINIEDINPITSSEYYARGSTGLLDAVGRTINAIGNRLSATPEDERPDKVIFVINTDGYENCSREFTKKQIKEMIEHQQSKYSWVFMFLGANIDAASEAGGLGIASSHSHNYAYTSEGISSAYSSVDAALCSIRSLDSDFMCAASVDGAISKAFDGIEL